MAGEGHVPQLANLQYCSSPLTGATLWRPEVCTAEHGHHCHILAEQKVWNEFLSAIHLELKEKTPGKLSLVLFDPSLVNSACFFYPFIHRAAQSTVNPWPACQMHEANTLLYLLLSEHRCVVEVCLKAYTDTLPKYNGLISSGLQVSSARKSFILLDSGFVPLSEDAIPYLSFFSGLSEIKLRMKDGLNKILCSALATSSCVKALTLKYGRSHDLEELGELMNVLANTITLTALDIESCCFCSVHFDFTSCLGRHLLLNEALTTLRIRGGSSSLLKNIVQMLRQNWTLSVVAFEGFKIDNEAASAIERYLTGNLTLRSFNLIHCIWYGIGLDDLPPGYHIPNYGELSERIHPWLLILQKNRTLEELTLSMISFCPAECNALLAKLRQNSSLKKVTVEGLASYLLLWYHYQGWQDPAVDSPDVIFAECKQLYDIRFPYIRFGDHETVILLNSLVSCNHLRAVKFCLSPSYCNEEILPLIARYIEESTTLKELSLIFRYIDTHDQYSSGSVKVLESLSRNKSIRKLHVFGWYFDQLECAVLAKVIESTTTITDYFFAINIATFEGMVGSLTDIEKNFTVLSLDFKTADYATLSKVALCKLLALKDIAQRNLGLVTCAAHCVEGDLSRHCAEAIELVASNPALSKKVCELFSVDSQQAAEMIQHSLSCLQQMDKFMQAAGVVKEQVTCENRNDGKPQLCDLVEDCWLCIRRYLKVSDVLHNV